MADKEKGRRDREPVEVRRVSRRDQLSPSTRGVVDKFNSKSMAGSVRLNFDPRSPYKKTKWTRFFAVGWYDYDTPLIDTYQGEKQYQQSSNTLGDAMYLRGCRVGLLDQKTALDSFPYQKSDSSAKKHVFTAVKSLTRSKINRKKDKLEHIHQTTDAGTYNLFHDLESGDGNLIQHADSKKMYRRHTLFHSEQNKG